MAKNFFEQLITKAGEIWSGPKTHYDHAIYMEDSGGLSGVAKYLAKQEQAAIQQETASVAAQASTTAATGVEKYLARQQGSVATKAAVQPSPTTGVGKYLAKQALGGSAPVKEPVAIPTTGVGKYLAGMPLTKPPVSKAAVETKQPEQAKSEPVKASAPAKKTAAAKAEKASVTAKPVKTPAPETEELKTTAHVGGTDVIHFDHVTQCQARTTKGGQCKNTNHLTKLNRTINKQKYQFVACPQHHNDTFKPYPPFLEA